MSAQDEEHDQNHYRDSFESPGKLSRMICRPSEEKVTKNRVSEIKKVAENLARAFR